MALRLKPETREAWKKRVEAGMTKASWRPVPRAEPAPEPSSNTFDIYCKTWVDT
jgi:hypothetical protein